MKSKKMAMFLCVMLGMFCGGCGAQTEQTQVDMSEEWLQSAENVYSEEISDTQEENKIQGINTEEPGSGTEQTVHAGDTNAVEEKSDAESIQDEIAGVEEKSREYENADWGSMGQQDMNQLTAQWYQLWDEELNSLWNRLSEEMDAETKEQVLDEQRAWIKRKEESVNGAGALAFGGSLQAQLENTVAEEMTRARAYTLAGYLAEVRKEAFSIPAEIQESIARAEVNLEDVFEKFEGVWMFDAERGACVAIERSETCDYGVEGSNWTVWVTGGDIISDLDVYGYTDNSILFKVEHDDYESFYELSFNMANSVNLAYGTSLDAMDDVIVCD